ncbi:MAG: bestrophin family protein [Xenococcaceae cyanobacterium]
MIVRKNLRIKFIILYIYKQTLYFITLSTLLYFFYAVLGFHFLVIPFVPLGVLGTALAIFLAFRNNSSYGRWWEARTLWSNLTSSSRTFGRQVNAMISLASRDDSDEVRVEVEQFKKEIIYRQMAYVNALRLQLRRQENWHILKEFLSPDEYSALLGENNKANSLLNPQSVRLEYAVEKGYLKDNRLLLLDNPLRELCNLQGGCERIKETHLLRQYNYFTRLFTWVFCTLLPFGLVKELGELTIPLSTLIFFVFIVLALIGEKNEDPFENRIQDGPITAICRTIERDLKMLLNELNIPPILKPVKGILM